MGSEKSFHLGQNTDWERVAGDPEGSTVIVRIFARSQLPAEVSQAPNSAVVLPESEPLQTRVTECCNSAHSHAASAYWFRFHFLGDRNLQNSAVADNPEVHFCGAGTTLVYS